MSSLAFCFILGISNLSEHLSSLLGLFWNSAFIHYSSFLSFTKYLLSTSFVPDTPLHTGNTEGNNTVSGLRHKQVLRRRTYENVFIVEVPLIKITTHFHNNLCSFLRFIFLHSIYHQTLYHPLWGGAELLSPYLCLKRTATTAYGHSMSFVE